MFNFLKKKQEEPTHKEEFRSFGIGKVLPLEEVPDQVFAKKMLGDGYALDLTDGKIVAPVSGEVVVVFPTGHAFGIKTKDGIEILVHLGIDTVELNGLGFNSQVKQGQHVKQGDVLTYMDLEAIKNAGKPTISPLVITSMELVELHRAHEMVTHETEGIISIQK